MTWRRGGGVAWRGVAGVTWRGLQGHQPTRPHSHTPLLYYGLVVCILNLNFLEYSTRSGNLPSVYIIVCAFYRTSRHTKLIQALQIAGEAQGHCGAELVQGGHCASPHLSPPLTSSCFRWARWLISSYQACFHHKVRHLYERSPTCTSWAPQGQQQSISEQSEEVK